MKLTTLEFKILMFVAPLIGVYDFFTLTLQTLIITAICTAGTFLLSKSLFLVTLVLLVPQFLRFVNIFTGVKETMGNPDEISQRVEALKKKYSQGVNLNPETSARVGGVGGINRSSGSSGNSGNSEKFTNAKPLDISARVEELKKKGLPKVQKVSGIVDTAMPSEIYPIQGNPSYPNFMEETMGTALNSNTNIHTTNENSIPAVGTMNSYPKESSYMTYDDVSISSALARTLTNPSGFNGSTIKSVETSM